MASKDCINRAQVEWTNFMFFFFFGACHYELSLHGKEQHEAS